MWCCRNQLSEKRCVRLFSSTLFLFPLALILFLPLPLLGGPRDLRPGLSSIVSRGRSKPLLAMSKVLTATVEAP